MHGNGVRSRRPTISPKVIKELLRLGYLQPAKRFKPHIVERALVRLRADLVRDGVVRGSSPLNDHMPAAPDDNQQSPAASRPSVPT
jgi:hypothetical protein